MTTLKLWDIQLPCSERKSEAAKTQFQWENGDEVLVSKKGWTTSW